MELYSFIEMSLACIKFETNYLIELYEYFFVWFLLEIGIFLRCQNVMSSVEGFSSQDLVRELYRKQEIVFFFIKHHDFESD